MIASYAQLDSETRDYLAAVKRTKGVGAPGIYIAAGSNAWPVLGGLLGGAMFLATIGIMLALPKSAWAVAMLVTAGLWLGGWLVAYPFRRWLFNRLGTFTFFDPHSVYQVNADEVTITDIGDMTGLDIVHNTSNNSYANSTLRFRLPGRGLKLTVNSKRGVDQVDFYYQALGEIETDARWSAKNPSEQGAIAVYTAQNENYPEDLKLVDLAIEMPTTDATAGKSGGGMGLRYLMLLALAGAIYAAAWQMLQPVQDHEAFRTAQKEGVQGYRDYLLDDRNQLHRDEAKQKIKELYAPIIANAEQQATTPEYRRGLTAILNNLSECEGLPAVSIRVTEEPGVGPGFEGMKNSRERAVRTDLADALGTHFGVAYITFVECPADVKPHFDLTFKALDDGKLQWRLAFRATPESEPVLGPERTTAAPPNPIDPSVALKTAIFQDMLAIAAPTVVNLPLGGGDFDE